MPSAHYLGYYQLLPFFSSLMGTPSASIWKRVLIGLTCYPLIIRGSILIERWLGTPQHSDITSKSLFLLGSFLLGLITFIAVIGARIGFKIHLIARRYQALHGWIGIATGSLLAMGFLAGSLTLFAGPLQQWSTPSLPSSSPLTAPFPPFNDESFNKLSLQPPAQYRLTITSPSTARLSLPLAQELPLGLPAAQIIISHTPSHHPALYYLIPTPVPSFIGGVHRRMGLPLPERWAMPIVGMVCFFYGIALVSGVILLLPGLWRNLMTVRLQGHVRRLWLDLHSLLGLCSFPFHLIIALTTTLFAFFPLIHNISDNNIVAISKQNTLPLITPTNALVQIHKLTPTFQPHLLEYTLLPSPADTFTKRTALHAPLYSPNPLSQQPTQTRPSLFIQGTDNYNPLIGRDRASITLDPYTGVILDDINLPSHQNPARRLLTWCLALHFGSFGGEFVRWLYITLALCGVGFFYTANQLWLNAHHRAIKEQLSPRKKSVNLWIRHLIDGCFMGYILGLCGIIALSPLTTHLIPIENITETTHLSLASQATILQTYYHINLFYYACFSFSILSCYMLPRRIYQSTILLLSASFLSIALAVVALRHTAMQTTATSSLTIALGLATISLWSCAIFILSRKTPSPPAHPAAKHPPIPKS